MAGPGLPTNIDATYPDTGGTDVKIHQQHHDTIHSYINAYGGGVVGESLNALDPRVGAVGDGVTDNTAAFANATSLLSVGGGDFLIPPGLYFTSAGIPAMAGGTRIRGAGIRSTTVKAKAGASFTMFGTADNNVSRYGIHISDISLDGNASNMTGSAPLVDLPGATELTMQGVYILAPRGNAIRWRGATAGAPAIYGVFHNLVIRGDVAASQGDGVVFDSGSSDAHMTQSDIGYFPNGNGLTLSGHPGSSLSNINIWQCLNGFQFYWCQRSMVTACLADWSGHYGFYITGGQNLLFSSCSSHESSQTAQFYDGWYFDGDATTHKNIDISMDGCRAWGTTATAAGGTKAWIPNYGISLATSTFLDGLTVTGGSYRNNAAGAINAAALAASNVKIRGTLGQADQG